MYCFYLILENGIDMMDQSSLSTLAQQGKAHLLWRDAFFRATGEVPSNNKLLLDIVNRAKGAKLSSRTEEKKKIGRKLPKSSARGKSSGGKTTYKPSDKKKRKLISKKIKGDSKSKQSRRAAMKKDARKKIISKKEKKEKAPEL
jgi:hypothetical protein